jgi:Dyp-type peroxidase family
MAHAVVRPPAGKGEGPTQSPAYPGREDLDEPLLDLDQIQGIVIPGFLKPHQTLLCVRHGREEAELGEVKALLSDLLPLITDGRSALADRKLFKEGEASRQPLVGIAFTWPGLCSLTPTAANMSSAAFRSGMTARSALLGDPTDPNEPGHPSKWVVGGPANIPDFMIVIAGNHRTQVNLQVREISKRLRRAGCRVQRQDGNKLEASGKSREHFGFVDGISQPGIRGRPADAPDSFITPSRVAEWPASSLYGYPGQELVWPGEFVLGYPRSGPDPLLPGPIAEPDLPWMRNGSYLVYNRLLQNVGGFWKAMREEAARLSSLDGFAEISAEGLASRLVGRTRKGVPISRLQGPERSFHEGLGSNPVANNHFRFDSDTPRVNLTQGSDNFPMAKADPLGMACPLAAHIRKVNPRDGASDVGGEGANHRHRILRSGVPFGPRRTELKADPVAHEAERGQLFLCIQASIEEQFEFLQARWMNDDRRPRSPGGHDMISGRMPSTGDGVRRCSIFGAEGQEEDVRADERFITSSGGAYFFVPSLCAIRDVLAAQ